VVGGLLNKMDATTNAALAPLLNPLFDQRDQLTEPTSAAATPMQGMTRAEFGRLTGFAQGPLASSQASTAASAEVIANLKSAGVTPLTISTFQRFYAGAARSNPANLAAVQRAALLANILKAFQ
jgi:hypothetical protein